VWFQVCAIALGVWLMISPALLPATSAGASVDRIAGPVVIWVGVLALRSVTRSFRVIHLLSGLFLTIAPWLVTNTMPLRWSSVAVGWALIVLAILRGVRRQRIGDGWWAALKPWRVFGEEVKQRAS
jgi:hypothetical protein